jgi:septal ring factor EnvC (AmiA/AmiB activator)
MRYAVAVIAGCLLMSAQAWGTPQAAGAAAGTKSVAATNAKVAKSKAEVDQLQQHVGQQESASRDAAERLQQQDRTIAQLREQLKAAQEASKKPGGGH